MFRIQHTALRIAFALIATALAGPASAQSLPKRTLTLVVPFAAGGPSDVAGRLVAQALSEVLGQNVVVENPVGAGGTVGSLRVSKSTPDGSQFVIGNSGTHAWSQSLYKNPPYNTLADFTMLGLLVEAPRVIITPKNFPANTFQEFTAYVKANQSTVKYGHAGPGLGVARELHPAQRSARRRHRAPCPIAASRSAMQDLIAGRIDYMCDFAFHLEAADGRQLRESNCQHRQATLADPAAAPDGDRARPQFRCQRLAGAVPRQGHAGTDRAPAQRRAEQDARPALAAGAIPDRRRRVAAPAQRSPEYFRKFVADEIARWSGPIKASGVTVE